MSTDRRLPRSAISAAVAQALCAGAGLGLALPALAQEAAAQAELAPVIVTAQRREQDILDVPYNISAVPGDEIALRQTFDTPELLRSVAGVAVVDRGQRNAAVVSGIRIRGLNVDSAALGDYAVSAVSTVSTYVDDTPIFANFLLKDIQRVEVLRGPQGTLYGSGALGGTVRYVMNQPELGEFSASVGGSLSSVEGSDGIGASGDLTLNMPVGDTMALRLNLTVRRLPGPHRLREPLRARRQRHSGRAEWRSRSGCGVSVARKISTPWKCSTAASPPLGSHRILQRDAVASSPSRTTSAAAASRRPAPTDSASAYRDYENGSIQLEPATRDAELAALEDEHRPRLRNPHLLDLVLRPLRRQHEREHGLLRAGRFPLLLLQLPATDGVGRPHLERPRADRGATARIERSRVRSTTSSASGTRTRTCTRRRTASCAASRTGGMPPYRAPRPQSAATRTSSTVATSRSRIARSSAS